MILQWEVTPDEQTTLIIELIFTIIAIGSCIEFAIIKRIYHKLAKKGYNIIFFGVFLFGLHILSDFLDTLAMKKIDGTTTTLYLVFDYLDAIFAFIGLFIIGYGFYQIAKDGMEIWEGDVK
ncbi:MAG: hypothetical protein K9W44_06050 [Candidatus Lokiarchaeota archaeon]|nr:hypothetical protein [Candidatus Harpocratesius repetitus]